MESSPTTLKVDTSADPGCESSPSGMQRNRSFLWDWRQPTPPESRSSSCNPSAHGGSTFSGLGFGSSREASGHGGSLFGTRSAMSGSREGSLHGGTRMKRNVSFSELSNTNSREGSQHGSTLPRTGSFLWDWKAGTPPMSRDVSRDASLRGGNLWPTQEAAQEVPADFGGDQPPSSIADGIKHSLSFVWDWGKYRQSPPPTPGGSLHGGNQFVVEEEADPLKPAIMPPKAMTKQLSIGSFMWNWGQARASPPATPGASKHGGNAFAPEDAETKGGEAMSIS